jgi:signal transduction histidine kinase
MIAKWLREDSIAKRLQWAGMLTVLLLSFVWAGTLSYFMHKADRAIFERRIASHTHVLIYKAESDKYEFERNILATPTSRPTSIKTYQETVSQLEVSIGKLTQVSSPADNALIQRLIQSIGEYKTKYAELLALYRARRLDDAGWRRKWSRVSNGLDRILDATEDPIEMLVARSTVRVEHSRYQLLCASILMLIIGIFTGFMVFNGFARSITRPLLRLKEAAQQIGDGRLDTVIDGQAPGEIGILAEAFQVMVQNVKKNQAVAIQVGKMASVGQFAAGVAHDVNNPVGVILGFAQSLLRRFPENDPLRAPLESIEREALRCKTLVQDLLAFSRSNNPNTTIQMENLPQVLERALTLVTTLARSKQVELIRSLAADLPLVPVDSGQIQQAVINLCTNAIDAMPQGGKLTVSIARTGNHAAISVQDTGTGIAPEIRERIFEAFFTTKEEGKGTGLGLSLIANIVKAHRGEITLQSEVGHGSTFTLRLPIDAAPPARMAA